MIVAAIVRSLEELIQQVSIRIGTRELIELRLAGGQGGEGQQRPAVGDAGVLAQDGQGGLVRRQLGVLPGHRRSDPDQGIEPVERAAGEPQQAPESI